MVSALGMAFEVVESLANSDLLITSCCAHRQLHGPKRQFASTGGMAAPAALLTPGYRSEVR